MFVVGAVRERPESESNLALFASTTVGSLLLVTEMWAMFGPKIEPSEGKGDRVAGRVGFKSNDFGNVATYWISSEAAVAGPGGLTTDGLADNGKEDGNFGGLPILLFSGASGLDKSSLSAGIGFRV